MLDQSGRVSLSNHYGDAVRNFGHEGGDVVKTVLNGTEGGS